MRRPPAATRRRTLAAAFSVAAHVAVVLLVVTVTPAPPPPFEPPPMAVAMVELAPLVVEPPPPPDEPPKPVKAPAEAPKVQPSQAPPKPAAASRRPVVARPSAPAPQAITLPVGDRPVVGEGVAADGPPGPSEGQIAGATTAESGGGAGGGACNMARRLQTALRKDPDVRRVVAAAHHEAGPAIRALWVWNGDWIRSHGQDGAGLAALRETILWEVGFAPAACRAERMHGLVLITLADGPGAPRVALGGGSWRWSDLLLLRSGRAGG